ncbi:DUF2917 domain-containing protein [Noviherbaspirillum sp.]|jgi:hypothetical protein|uniref:DUF2917 domain-containing protein n=1 Tax=Noviherbaspirillum sp. TaxID=1926288 RepID=UPI0025FD1C65|nr:DUF2917 domain-containing protein [Noviherbaspirillum sp.]
MTAHSIGLGSWFVGSKPDGFARDRLPPQHDADAAVELILPYRNSIALPDASGSIRCLSGALWVTRTNDSEDHIVEPGTSFRFEEGDHVVVQGIKPSKLSLSLAPEPPLPFVPCA